MCLTCVQSIATLWGATLQENCLSLSQIIVPVITSPLACGENLCPSPLYVGTCSGSGLHRPCVYYCNYYELLCAPVLPCLEDPLPLALRLICPLFGNHHWDFGGRGVMWMSHIMAELLQSLFSVLCPVIGVFWWGWTIVSIWGFYNKQLGVFLMLCPFRRILIIGSLLRAVS